MRQADFPIDDTRENEDALYEWALTAYRASRGSETAEPVRSKSDVIIDFDGHTAFVMLRDPNGVEVAFYRASREGMRLSA